MELFNIAIFSFLCGYVVAASSNIISKKIFIKQEEEELDEIIPINKVFIKIEKMER